jgi:hypothetical protein
MARQRWERSAFARTFQVEREGAGAGKVTEHVIGDERAVAAVTLSSAHPTVRVLGGSATPEMAIRAGTSETRSAPIGAALTVAAEARRLRPGG